MEHLEAEGGSERVARPVSGFEVFYRDHFDGAVRLAWLLCRSSVAADDLAQDAFLALQAQFEEVTSPSAWINRAIVNRARTLASQPGPPSAAVAGARLRKASA